MCYTFVLEHAWSHYFFYTTECSRTPLCTSFFGQPIQDEDACISCAVALSAASNSSTPSTPTLTPAPSDDGGEKEYVGYCMPVNFALEVSKKIAERAERLENDDNAKNMPFDREEWILL